MWKRFGEKSKERAYENYRREGVGRPKRNAQLQLQQHTAKARWFNKKKKIMLIKNKNVKVNKSAPYAFSALPSSAYP